MQNFIMEDQNIYVIDDHDQQQEETLNEPSERDYRNDDSGHVQIILAIMVMNAAQVKSSEYETHQVGNTTPTII